MDTQQQLTEIIARLDRVEAILNAAEARAQAREHAAAEPDTGQTLTWADVSRPQPPGSGKPTR